MNRIDKLRCHEWKKSLQCINGLRSVAAIQPAACLNVVMMWLFIYCYFGDEVTSRFDGIETKLYLCNWYLLPLPLEKCIPMIINSTHKPIYLQGFGSTSCTRESFKKVILIVEQKCWIFFIFSIESFLDYLMFSSNFSHSFTHCLGCQRWIFLFHNATSS